ncbi:unnamed protein product [Discosporangium mesarthrocarpum]
MESTLHVEGVVVPSVEATEPAAESESPVLVFLNSKSGGQKGSKVLDAVSKHVPSDRVFDLQEIKEKKWTPEEKLSPFKGVPDVKVLICGGDGTMGWILSCIDRLEAPAGSFPVAMMPLGTGNDLARSFQWGAGFHPSMLKKNFLKKVRSARPTLLDRWLVSVMPYDPRLDHAGDNLSIPPTFTIHKYASVQTINGGEGSNSFSVSGRSFRGFSGLESDARVSSMDGVDVVGGSGKVEQQQRVMRMGRTFSVKLSEQALSTAILGKDSFKKEAVKQQTRIEGGVDSVHFDPNGMCHVKEEREEDMDTSWDEVKTEGEDEEGEGASWITGNKGKEREEQEQEEKPRAIAPAAVEVDVEQGEGGGGAGQKEELPGDTVTEEGMADAATAVTAASAKPESGVGSGEGGGGEGTPAEVRPEEMEEGGEGGGIVDAISSGVSKEMQVSLPNEAPAGLEVPVDGKEGGEAGEDGAGVDTEEDRKAAVTELVDKPAGSGGAGAGAGAGVELNGGDEVAGLFPAGKEDSMEFRAAFVEGGKGGGGGGGLTLMDNAIGSEMSSKRNMRAMPSMSVMRQFENWVSYDAVFCNYFSLGVDAVAAAAFHAHREKNPHLFTSQFRNQMWYVRKGFPAAGGLPCGSTPPPSVASYLDIKIKKAGGNWEQLYLNPGLRGIIVLNLQSYGGGRDLWGKNKDDESDPSHNDGLLEVVGISNIYGLGCIMSLNKVGARAKRIAQCCELELRVKRTIHMQIDGEPWQQAPAKVVIQRLGQATCLQAQ